MRIPRPRSLAAQMSLLLGIALLIAQLANFALILNERQKLSLAQVEGPAIDRFAAAAADLTRAAPGDRAAIALAASRHGARFRAATANSVPEAARDPSIEARLRAALEDQNVTAGDVRAGRISVLRGAQRDAPHDVPLLLLEARLADGRWFDARFVTPRRDPLLVARLAAATALLYLLVLGPTAWFAWRIARPLGALTRAAEGFGGRTSPPAVEPHGPDDLRRAITAFNAMNLRLLALLDEKDRMLGAIGHDLRTPLASLRIRLETMEPEEEREHAVAKIKEVTAMLESILDLARIGRAGEERRPVDVGSLAEVVAESHRELGRDVTMASTSRHVASVQPMSLMRAISNLVDNAIKYAGSARIAVSDVPGGIEVRVSDHGPGIPLEERRRVLEPFYRVESSRNRDTGGSGLGLAIARGIVEAQGGTIDLRAAEPHGLVAVLTLPA